MYSTIELIHSAIGELKAEKNKLTKAREEAFNVLATQTSDLHFVQRKIDTLESDLKSLYNNTQNSAKQWDPSASVGVDPDQCTDRPSCSEATSKNCN